MGRDCLVRAHWKILSDRVPGSVADVLGILLANRDLDPESLSGELGDLRGHLAMRGMEEGASLMALHIRRE